jgi:hypothetical protein
MIYPDDLIAGLMERVRRDLYSNRPDWFVQQAMIKRALTYPAAWLGKKHVEIPAARYKAILEEIISGIVREGQLEKVTYLSRYFYTCVQRHMDHHGDDYYREGVSVRNNVTIAMSQLEKAQRGADSTIPVLAQVHATLVAGVKPPKHMRPSKDPQQPDLFAPKRRR